VIGVHEAAGRILQLNLAQELEADLPADSIRGQIVNRGEGVDGPMPPLRPGSFDCSGELVLRVSLRETLHSENNATAGFLLLRLGIVM
jgi:hypothetical protein